MVIIMIQNIISLWKGISVAHEDEKGAPSSTLVFCILQRSYKIPGLEPAGYK